MSETDRLAAANIVAALIMCGNIEVNGGYQSIATAYHDVATALATEEQRRKLEAQGQ